jgi:hypothetical protein
MLFRLKVKLLVRLLGLLFALVVSAQTNSRPHPKPGQSPDPKCVFLRHEADRVRHDGQDYLNRSPLAVVKTADDLAAVGSTLGDWANFTAAIEVFAAREGFLRQAATACQHKLALSDPSRLNDISAMRAKQVKRLEQTWQRLAGDQGKDFETALTAQLSAAYEAETRSFYNPELSQFNDPDIGKDYPDLLSLIQNSSLDQTTKSFYAANARLLHYEEAGQLTNILKGIDTEHGLDFAYLLRKKLSDRAAAAAQQQEQLSKQLSTQQEKDRNNIMTTYALEALGALVLIALLWLWSSRAAALRRGIRTGATRSPYWGGNAEWIFWEPGESVVLLQHKRLVPMMDPQGGYKTISSWKGQEYKGKISYKTQFSTWTSDPIITSDGLGVNLGLSVWWKIVDAGKFVSGVAADYHVGQNHYGVPASELDVATGVKQAEYWTKEAAERWIRQMAAGTLREQINQLPAEKLISPYVQAYIARGPNGESSSAATPIPNFSEQLGKVQEKLNEKTLRYGIEIERLEVQELKLPPVYQEKLEAVRVAFLEPTKQLALTETQKIALNGLKGVLGEETFRLIEILKHVDLSHVSANPFTGVIPIVQPIVENIQQHTERALPPTSARSAAAGASQLPAASGDGKPK